MHIMPAREANRALLEARVSLLEIEFQIIGVESKLRATDNQEEIQTHMEELRKLNIDKARLKASVFVFGAFLERAIKEAAPRDSEDVPQVRTFERFRRFVARLRTK